MKDALLVTALSIVPKNRVARWMGAFTRARLPRAANRALLGWYVRKYAVDLDECEGTIADYPTLAAFFTRALRDGVRPVDPSPDALVSPVDGVVYAAGRVDGGRLPQAPGITYAVDDLIGGPSPYEGGAYAVIYLSPRDYHRVHVPREGRVVRCSYRPGRLWPVFPAATRRIRGLFAVNERVTTFVASDAGEYALVMVGAFGVGRMRVVYDEALTNEGRPARDLPLDPPRAMARAEELGRFEMGSTVILVFPPGMAELSVAQGDRVRVGARIGSVTPG